MKVICLALNVNKPWHCRFDILPVGTVLVFTGHCGHVSVHWEGVCCKIGQHANRGNIMLCRALDFSVVKFKKKKVCIFDGMWVNFSAFFLSSDFQCQLLASYCSVPWRCWLGIRKIIRRVKIDWWGVGVVICLERVPADATASQNPSSLASFKSWLFSPFWYRLTQVVLEKRPLNGCSNK